MIRPLIIVVNLIIVMMIKLFVGTPSAEVKAPKSVKAGEAFLVEVTIATNGETDFMRYSMDLPEGWTAEKVEASGSSYKFDKQTVKFLWSRVGEVKELKISYKVTPAADAKGDVSLNCKLSHTVDNLPANIPLTPLSISVIESGTAAVNTFPVADSTAKPSVVINIERAVPSTEITDVFVVTLVLHKDDLTSFGKIEDTLPSGFTAKLVKADGSDFKFENGIVKFSWFVLPAKHTMTVQYRVTVDPSVSGDQLIGGHFSYVENEVGKVIPIAPSTVKIKAKDPVVTKDPDPVVTKDPDPIVTKDPDPIVTKDPDPIVTKDPVVTKDPDPIVTKDPDPIVTKDPDPIVTKMNTNVNSTGVNFCVQIAAFQRMLPISYFKETYHLSSTINAEQNNGLNKYTIGAFNSYQEAHDSRNQIRNNGISDAFVVAHNNGKRITVQEALMITSQKWMM